VVRTMVRTTVSTKNMANKYIRKLQRTSRYSYCLSIPKELIKEFKWKEKQKLELSFGGKKHKIEIVDWKPFNSKKQENKKTKKQ